MIHPSSQMKGISSVAAAVVRAGMCDECCSDRSEMLSARLSPTPRINGHNSEYDEVSLLSALSVCSSNSCVICLVFFLFSKLVQIGCQLLCLPRLILPKCQLMCLPELLTVTGMFLEKICHITKISFISGKMNNFVLNACGTNGTGSILCLAELVLTTERK